MVLKSVKTTLRKSPKVNKHSFEPTFPCRLLLDWRILLRSTCALAERLGRFLLECCACPFPQASQNDEDACDAAWSERWDIVGVQHPDRLDRERPKWPSVGQAFGGVLPRLGHGATSHLSIKQVHWVQLGRCRGMAWISWYLLVQAKLYEGHLLLRGDDPQPAQELPDQLALRRDFVQFGSCLR